MTQIAFLGLGAMGIRMSARLIAAGHDVTVWNRTPKAEVPDGAKVAGSPLAAAQGADIVIAMVRDDTASARVWLDPDTGAFAGMAPGTIAIDCSTLSVGHVGHLADAAAARGLRFLDAPLAGSRPQAEAGQLIFLVGGEAAALAKATPVLTAMGGAVHHAGAVGAGAAMKLAVNALFCIQVAAVAELLALLRATGVDPARGAEILGATPVASPAAKAAMAGMLAGAFQPMFPLDLAEKDLGYAQAAAADLPMVGAARLVMQQAISQGFGDLNLTAVARLYAAV
jgi:3-hydroxyisobutyrate dehydrogenase